MNGLTLRHLRYFSALAETQHFARAADLCAISQPALSLQIKQLEELIGAPLVERTSRSVRLTRLGEAISGQARDALRIVDDIGNTARASTGELSGPFRLGVIPTIGPYLLPSIVAQTTETFPQLELHLRETVTPSLVDELHKGQIDAAILALPLSEPGFHEMPLFTESFVLVRPKSQSDLPVPKVEDLQAMKLLLLEEGHCFRDQALAFCDMGRERYRNVMDGSSLTTLVQLVASGVGVTLIPEMAARVETRLSDVDLAHFPAPEPNRTIGMVWRRSSPLATQLKAMAETVRQAAEAHRKGGFKK